MTEPRLDPAEVEALWVRHAADVRHFLLGVVKDRDLAEEVLQQTFVTTLERGHTADEATLRGWLFRVAFNHAMEHKRRGSTGRRALDALRSAGSEREPPGPVDAAMRDETVRRVRAAIDALPTAQQRVVEMRMLEAKTFAEIADQLGVPLGTALTRMRLASTKLRAALERKDER